MTTNEAGQHERDAQIAAEAMLDAIAIYESLGGELFDPAHPSARQELRRVAVRGWGKRSWKYASKDERAMIDRLIDQLIALTTGRVRVAV